MPTPSEIRAQVLVTVIADSHLAPVEQFAASVHDRVGRLGLSAQLLLVDLAERRLLPVPTGRSGTGAPVAVEDTTAGRAYQLGRLVPDRGPAAADGSGDAAAPELALLWVPLLNGIERVGVLRVALHEEAVDDPELRQWLWALGSVVAHVLMSKLEHSLALQELRAGGLTTASELMWQLMPSRTFATDRVVISALLEPSEEVAGDAFDYALDGVVHVGVFDGAGHDLMAGVSTTLAVTAVRNARRRGVLDLAELAAHADEVVAGQDGPLRFVTAVLARLDTGTGELHYLLAGHPAPLLIRGGRVVGELSHPPRVPLGLAGPGRPVPHAVDAVGREQLEPGDRLLLYSDGVTEARDRDGEFFGEERLAELAERAELDGLSAPETLRRLVAAVLAHQHDRLQDDATLLLLEWARDGHLQLLPGPG